QHRAHSSMFPTRILVSHASDSMTRTANGQSLCSFVSSISADGRFIVYKSKATNLVAGQVDTNNTFDCFLYDVGLRVKTAQGVTKHNLWADTVDDEKRMWADFLDILLRIKNPILSWSRPGKRNSA